MSNRKRLNKKDLDKLGVSGKQRHATNIILPSNLFYNKKQIILEETKNKNSLSLEEYDNHNLKDTKMDWNDEIANAVAASMPKISPTVPSMLSKKLIQLSKECNIPIDYDKFSAQALASQMGNVLEVVYEFNIKNMYQDNDNVTYIKGEDISKRIKEMRSSKNNYEILNFKKELKETYEFSDKYISDVLSNGQNKKSIHLPDVIMIDKTGEVTKIKCAEMKASGQNDSSSVPENIDKLAYGTRNSAVEAYSGRSDLIIERAIIITAASVSSDGKFLHKNKWVNEIERRKDTVGDIKVFCNQEAFSWLSGKDISSDEYNKEFINTTAYAELKRIHKASQ
jgi:hypothetical protein